jgi:hypothetical protein
MYLVNWPEFFLKKNRMWESSPAMRQWGVEPRFCLSGHKRLELTQNVGMFRTPFCLIYIRIFGSRYVGMTFIPSLFQVPQSHTAELSSSTETKSLLAVETIENPFFFFLIWQGSPHALEGSRTLYCLLYRPSDYRTRWRCVPMQASILENVREFLSC